MPQTKLRTDGGAIGMDTEDADGDSAISAEQRSADFTCRHDDHPELQLHPKRDNKGASQPDFVALIEPRLLYAQCIVKSLRMADSSCDFDTYQDLSEWIELGDSEKTSLVLLSMPRGSVNKSGLENLRSHIAQLQARKPSISFAVLCDDAASKGVVEALQVGARGYLLTSLPLRLMIQILHLLISGGTYVPSSSFLNIEPNFLGTADHPIERQGTFGSHKQMMVARALRSGAPNKVIAYQLSMCESTVKVHVRNIMKKLNAKNRTEIALLVTKMFPLENL